MISEKLTDYQTRADSKPSQSTEEYSAHSFNANVANAAFKATGKRVWELPITPDKGL